MVSIHRGQCNNNDLSLESEAALYFVSSGVSG